MLSWTQPHRSSISSTARTKVLEFPDLELSRSFWSPALQLQWVQMLEHIRDVNSLCTTTSHCGGASTQAEYAQTLILVTLILVNFKQMFGHNSVPISRIWTEIAPHAAY